MIWVISKQVDLIRNSVIENPRESLAGERGFKTLTEDSFPGFRNANKTNYFQRKTNSILPIKPDFPKQISLDLWNSLYISFLTIARCSRG